MSEAVEYRAWYSTPADRGVPKPSATGFSEKEVNDNTWELRHSEECWPKIHYWETRTVTYSPWTKLSLA